MAGSLTKIAVREAINRAEDKTGAEIVKGSYSTQVEAVAGMKTNLLEDLDIPSESAAARKKSRGGKASAAAKKRVYGDSYFKLIRKYGKEWKQYLKEDNDVV